jgi:hypothetical protein
VDAQILGVRTSVVRVGAVVAAMAVALAAPQSTAQTAGKPSPTVTTAEATGITSLVQGSPTPKDCLRSVKEVCTYEIRGTETSNAYEGPGQMTQRITTDFTKPQSSAAGVCFPELGVGMIHTSQGDFNFYTQGQTCRPPQSAGVAPTFGNTMVNVVITGGTGRFQHTVGTASVSVVSHPPAPSLYHAVAAFVGLEPAR